jgi:hypothetical protein
MAMDQISVVSWSEDDVAEEATPIGWWGGFFEVGMRWKDYVENFDGAVHPYLEAARDSAVKNGIKATGMEHQYRRITPVFSDGRYFADDVPGLGRLHGRGMERGGRPRHELHGFLQLAFHENSADSFHLPPPLQVSPPYPRAPNPPYTALTSSSEGRHREAFVTAGRGTAPAGAAEAQRHSGRIGAPPGTTRSPCQELADRPAIVGNGKRGPVLRRRRK